MSSWCLKIGYTFYFGIYPIESNRSLCTLSFNELLPCDCVHFIDINEERLCIVKIVIANIKTALRRSKEYED